MIKKNINLPYVDISNFNPAYYFFMKNNYKDLRTYEHVVSRTYSTTGQFDYFEFWYIYIFIFIILHYFN